MILSLLIGLVLQQPGDRVIGLLELPELFGPQPCIEYSPETFPVFSSPAETSSRRGVIQVVKPMKLEPNGGCTAPEVASVIDGRMSGLSTEEIGYEEPAVVVYERSGSWFRIAAGWIQVADPMQFTSYSDLIVGDERLPHLTADWDGRLHTEPLASSAPIALSPAWRMLVGDDISFVRVLESRIVANQLWFRVRLGSGEFCVDLPTNLEVVEGWISGYTASGARTVWFSSRGC